MLVIKIVVCWDLDSRNHKKFILSAFMRCGLEFLTEHEVEVAATLGAKHLVEAIAPVDTHHTQHRNEDAHNHT